MKFFVKQRQVTVETDKEVEPKFQLMSPIKYVTWQLVYIWYVIWIQLMETWDFRYIPSRNNSDRFTENLLTTP